MKRRSYLASVTSSLFLAGCNQRATPTTTTRTSSQPPTTRTDTSTTTGTTEPTTTPQDPSLPKTVQVSADGPSYPGLRCSVDLSTEKFTETHPPRLTATLTNTGDSALEFEFGQRPPFSRRTAEPPQYLLLEPDAKHERDQCWELPLETPIGELPLITLPTLQPGESLSVVLELWGNHTSPECLPTGDFTFVSNFRIKESDGWHGTANIINTQITKQKS